MALFYSNLTVFLHFSYIDRGGAFLDHTSFGSDFFGAFFQSFHRIIPQLSEGRSGVLNQIVHCRQSLDRNLVTAKLESFTTH